MNITKKRWQILGRVRRKIFFSKPTFFQDIFLASHHICDLANLYRLHANNEVAYYNVLFSVAIASAPLIIVELGTGPGVSSLAFRRVIQYYNSIRKQKGVLHTCDLDAKLLDPLQKWGNIVQTHLMSTNELAIRWLEHKTPIDLLFIDADHSYEQSLKDFQQFAPFVKPNGLVLMHDTFPLSEEHEKPQYSGGVYKTAQSIKREYRDEFELMTIPYLNGIGLLRKRGAKYF